MTRGVHTVEVWVTGSLCALSWRVCSKRKLAACHEEIFWQNLLQTISICPNSITVAALFLFSNNMTLTPGVHCIVIKTFVNDCVSIVLSAIRSSLSQSAWLDDI